MASQRITIATVGGLAADVILLRLGEWAHARSTADPNEWSSDQWPAATRVRADAFADELRANGCSLPVIHFVEWWDSWSAGDLFARWLTPLGRTHPVIIYGDRFEVYGYPLPDGGHLARHLAAAGEQQFVEYDWFIGRLREAVDAHDGPADRAVVVVLREVLGGLVTDDELRASMTLLPSWLSGG